jgi:hypothetical protein
MLKLLRPTESGNWISACTENSWGFIILFLSQFLPMKERKGERDTEAHMHAHTYANIHKKYYFYWTFIQILHSVWLYLKIITSYFFLPVRYVLVENTCNYKRKICCGGKLFVYIMRDFDEIWYCSQGYSKLVLSSNRRTMHVKQLSDLTLTHTVLNITCVWAWCVCGEGGGVHAHIHIVTC